jgi:hypothetical protein
MKVNRANADVEAGLFIHLFVITHSLCTFLQNVTVKIQLLQVVVDTVEFLIKFYRLGIP